MSDILEAKDRTAIELTLKNRLVETYLLPLLLTSELAPAKLTDFYKRWRYATLLGMTRPQLLELAHD